MIVAQKAGKFKPQNDLTHSKIISNIREDERD
jgi:hypothetical protein